MILTVRFMVNAEGIMVPEGPHQLQDMSPWAPGPGAMGREHLLAVSAHNTCV